MGAIRTDGIHGGYDKLFYKFLRAFAGIFYEKFPQGGGR